jgi:2-polyprenyl-6-methoxyphenol hydroxylase-like FAD-dependent oxidoreductase
MIGHKQPALEKHLRTVVESSELSQIRTRCTLTSIQEDKDWVYVTYIDSTGEERQVKSRFLAAADGKTGFTRKNYLEPKGIRLDWAEQ